MTDREKLEMIELVLNSNLKERNKLYEIQMGLLDFISLDSVKALCEIVGTKKKAEVVKMNETTKIEGLGTIELKDTHMTDGRIEVHIPVDVDNEQIEALLDKCRDDFLSKHTELTAEDLCYDIRIVLLFGGFTSAFIADPMASSFLMNVIIWEETDTDNVEFYDDIPVSFEDTEAKKLKKVIWDGVGNALFEIQ